MENLDLKKTLSSLYNPSAKTVSVVDVPPMAYLMIDGRGDPNSAPAYRQAVEALYGLAYAIRGLRKDIGEVFTVMPLEGLWSFDGEQTETFSLTSADKARFIWTLMILQPDSITPEIAAQAREIARKKKPSAALEQVRFESYHEGEAVQIMHLGSYDTEGPTVARLHQHIADNGWTLGRRHHEIYLSDPRKVAPEKMKTVIRQPFERG